MSVNVTTFLDLLAGYIAAKSNLIYSAAGDRQLWVMEAQESIGCAAVYSVLRPYGGEVEYVPKSVISVQSMTLAVSAAAAVAQSQLIRDALQDDDKRPLRAVDIGTSLTRHRILAITQLGIPSQVGRDAANKAMVTFNFDAHVVFTGAAQA